VPESIISVKDLVVDYESGRGTVRAVDHVDLEVGAGEFFTLLGPSGCGKTTTLRAVAGLETPTSGEISLAGTVVYSSDHDINVPAYARRLGMVFQSYAVWPHMSVLANVVYPLRRGRNKVSDRKVARDRALRALERVQLSAMADRNATELSGGQQQRVALARALVTDPQVLLLDEPLSNLDAALRADMRIEMEELVKAVGTTALYVTHDQVEALAMSDHVAVMRGGKVVQLAAPKELYEHPTTLFAASFLGTMNLVSGRVLSVADEGRLTSVELDEGVRLDAKSPNGSLEDAGRVRVGVRPEHLTIVAEDGSSPPAGVASIRGTMRKQSFIGDQVIALVEVGSEEWQVRCNPEDLMPERGAPIQLRAPHHRFLAFREEAV
jgi:iron(III) transport system ATP-binding protein